MVFPNTGAYPRVPVVIRFIRRNNYLTGFEVNSKVTREITTMLSSILGMVFLFERSQGFSPNSLYLNREHMRCICAETGGCAELKLSERLGLTVMIYPGIAHPRVLRPFRQCNIMAVVLSRFFRGRCGWIKALAAEKVIIVDDTVDF